MLKKYEPIIYGLIISLVILLILFLLQHYGASLLNLETRWLVVAGVPILIALIIGGYIYKFKGFGIELETRLQSPIGTSILQATDALEPMIGIEKGDEHDLHDLSQESRMSIQRLSFELGRRDYYVPGVVHQYVSYLPNLRYIEICDQNGSFQYLFPISVLKITQTREGPTINHDAVHRFIRSVSEGTIYVDFAKEAEGEYVDINDQLLAILPRVRTSKYGWLPVLTSHKRLVGVITKSAIEERIADDVIAAKESR